MTNEIVGGRLAVEKCLHFVQQVVETPVESRAISSGIRSRERT